MSTIFEYFPKFHCCYVQTFLEQPLLQQKTYDFRGILPLAIAYVLRLSMQPIRIQLYLVISYDFQTINRWRHFYNLLFKTASVPTHICVQHEATLEISTMNLLFLLSMFAWFRICDEGHFVDFSQNISRGSSCMQQNSFKRECPLVR